MERIRLLWKFLSKSWGKYWYEEIPPHTLAAFRILFGVYLLWYFARMVPDSTVMFSAEGIYTPYFLDITAPSPLIARGLLASLLVTCLLFIIGWRTAIVTSVLFVLFTYHYLLNLAVTNVSFDRLSLLFLFIICFAKLDGVWALTGRKSRKSQNVPAWPAKLICMQMAFLYFGAAVWKIVNPLWRDGKILEYSFQGIWATDLGFSIAQLGLPSWFFTMLVYSVILFQLTLGPLLYSRRYVYLGIGLGASFHTSNWLLLGLPEFMICVTTYVLFVPGSDLQRLVGNSSALLKKLNFGNSN